MSTVSIPSSVATPSSRTVRCSGCHGMYTIPADAWLLMPLCPSCKHSAALAEAVKLLNDTIALRDGTGVFADLTEEERREQYRALTGTDRIRLNRVSFMRIVRDIDSDSLVDLTAVAADEISRRLGSTDVVDADRRIEPSAETTPTVDEYSVDSPLRIEIEDQLEDEARELVLAGEAAEQDADRWDGLS